MSSGSLASENTVEGRGISGTDGSQPVAADYKAMLDEAAEKKNAPKETPEEPPRHPVVETVSQYVQQIGKMTGLTEPEKPEEPTTQGPPPGPPHRPIHDTQIEEFVRDQHRSKKVTMAEAEA